MFIYQPQENRTSERAGLSRPSDYPIKPAPGLDSSMLEGRSFTFRTVKMSWGAGRPILAIQPPGLSPVDGPSVSPHAGRTNWAGGTSGRPFKQNR